MFCYSNADIRKGEEADEIFRFIDFWTRQHGQAPQHLVFDSKLTTYAGLDRLDAALYAEEQRRGDCARARRRWQREQSMFDPAHLVFIDETCTSTDMVRQYARGPRGERVIGYAPGGHRKTMTFITGLRQRGMTAPAVIDGAMNGPMFVGYIEQILAPTLKRGEIVFMDNASVHKSLASERRLKR